MQNKEFTPWFYSFQQQAMMLNERRLIVLDGDNAWASSLLKTIDSKNCGNAKYHDCTWLVYGENENIKANIAKQRFRDKLGSESDFVVFQDPDLTIDAFAALSGTLVAGGVFFLLINDNSQVENSLFYQRFFNIVNSFSEHVVLEQSKFILPELKSNAGNAIEKNNSKLSYDCVTQEQVIAVEAVIKVLTGKRNKPLILTADRGRGKSCALAIACSELLKMATKEYELKLVITAADISSLSVFFSRLVTCFPGGELQKNKFTTLHGSVEFIAIDQLLKESKSASLVLVDEAAAIPIYLLESLFLHYSRLVFSSTIHGYEGAGRGFALKFQKTLTSKFPQRRNLHIHEPIRWRNNDPLEQLVFESCLLNAELPNINEGSINKSFSQLLFKQYSANELVGNEELFTQVFSVLVTAHYQTKPSDVKMLLDNSQVRLVCLLSQEVTKQQVIAVALLIEEGSSNDHIIETEDISAIKQSKRRLKNHFVPQSLLTQCGIEYAFDYYYMRVMRIAVHPQLQQQGIGSYFLEQITHFATLQGADFLSSSFGATKSLLSFWLANEFQLARIGFNKDKASGEQSALVLKALSQVSITALEDINAEFYRSFDYLLADEYKYLPAELVALIISYCPKSSHIQLTVRDKENIQFFAQGHRQYSSCVFSLHLWLKIQLSSSAAIIDKDKLVFISRIFQKMSINELCKLYGFTGKRELEKFLRSKVQAALSL